MAVDTFDQTPKVGGEIFTEGGDSGTAPNRRVSRGFYLRERVSVSEDSAFATLSKKLPSNCVVNYIATKAASAVSVTGGQTATADSYTLSSTAPTSMTTNVTTQFLLPQQTTLTSNTRTLTAPANLVGSSNQFNTASTEVSLYIVPTETAAGTNRRVEVNTTTPTNGCHFDATASIDVYVWGERFMEPEDS